MEKLVIKENFKEWISRNAYLKMMKWLALPTIIFGVPILIFGLDKLDRLPFLMTILFIIFLPIVFIGALYLVYLPFFIIFELLPMLRPRTFTFGCDKERFFIQKDDKTVLNIPNDDVKKLKVESVVVKSVTPDKKIPYELNIKYKEGGEEKNMDFGFRKFTNSDTHRLVEWVNTYMALKKKKSCHEGMVAFPQKKEVGSQTVRKWGFANEEYSIVVEPQYLAVTRFCHGVALVCNDKEEWTVIDKKGDILSRDDIPEEMMMGYSLPFMADIWKFKDVDFVFDIGSNEWRKPLMTEDPLAYICIDLDGYIDSPFKLAFCLDQKK